MAEVALAEDEPTRPFRALRLALGNEAAIGRDTRPSPDHDDGALWIGRQAEVAVGLGVDFDRLTGLALVGEERRGDTLAIACMRMPANGADEQMRFAFVRQMARGDGIEARWQRPQQARELAAIEALGIAGEEIDQLSVGSERLEGCGVCSESRHIGAARQDGVLLGDRAREGGDIPGLRELTDQVCVVACARGVDHGRDELRIILGDNADGITGLIAERRLIRRQLDMPCLSRRSGAAQVDQARDFHFERGLDRKRRNAVDLIVDSLMEVDVNDCRFG